ncbi:MAG TPA: efflux transporter outer membrane subunit [Rhizomicrobium sp.]|nr:efflux transporter outer membrane subunit [Rhizomicrobium sp.]
MRFDLLLSSAAVAVLLAGCAVGPDYQGPPDAAPSARQARDFHRASLAPVENGQPAAASWWKALNDPELDRLVTRALSGSPTIKAAEARLREARATLHQQKANELPTVAGNALYLHTNAPGLGSLTGGGSGGSGSSSLNLYSVGFDATWELDIFGGTRRAVEAASARAEASEADLQDLHVSLAAEVVQAYIGLRDEQQRLVLAKQSAVLEQQVLDLTEQRRAHGAASDADVERLRTQLETTRGTAIPLQAQVDASLDQLAVLTGQEPGALDAELSASSPLPNLPAHVAVGDPASLLRRRPDIRKAERDLAASNAQIGQQIANYFPKVNLLGDVGWGSTDLGRLFDGGNFTPVVAPILQWNILDFGRTAAKVDQARAGRDEAIANYQSAVLSALQDAETALSRYGHQRDNVVSLARIKASADRTLALTRQRYAAGAASQIELVDDMRSQLEAAQNLAAGQAQLLTDYASLQKSLGLGWQAQA